MWKSFVILGSLLFTLAGCNAVQSGSSSSCSGCVAYNRDDYPAWIDADGDCQDTRAEVLIAENTGTLTYSSGTCVVAGGAWFDPYTGQVFAVAGDLDVDHMVPLAEAHESGAHAWDLAKRRDFANYLVDPGHLMAVSASANRSKGAKDPAEWLPPNTGFHAAYAQAWVAVKITWGLTADAAEIAALKSILGAGYLLPTEAPEANCTAAASCTATTTPPTDPPPTDPPPTDPPPSCCKVCTTSKACGDSCINVNYTCSKPPGCACNG